MLSNVLLLCYPSPPSPVKYRDHLKLFFWLLPDAAAVFGDVPLCDKENIQGLKGSESPDLANSLD